MSRAPNRALPRAVGSGDGDFEKPKPRNTTGALAKYIKLVPTASGGTVID